MVGMLLHAEMRLESGRAVAAQCEEIMPVKTPYRELMLNRTVLYVHGRAMVEL